jgi:hypothetical protein
MPVPAAKTPVYLRLDNPEIKIPGTGPAVYWHAAAPLLTVSIPIASVLSWYWAVAPELASGERLVVVTMVPLGDQQPGAFSVEELAPGNRDIGAYLFDT